MYPHPPMSAPMMRLTEIFKPGKNPARLRHGARLTERSRSDGNYTDLTSDGRTGGTRAVSAAGHHDLSSWGSAG